MVITLMEVAVNGSVFPSPYRLSLTATTRMRNAAPTRRSERVRGTNDPRPPMSVQAAVRLMTPVLVVLVVGLGLSAVRSSSSTTTYEAGPPPPSTYRGATSCSATACHGSVQPAAAKILRNEYIAWIERDKHSSAFSVLLGDRSRSIQAKLIGQGPHASENPRCLACHETHTDAISARQKDRFQEGVGCESCHGASDRWIGEHTRYDWAGRNAAEKEQWGMIATSDLTSRAQACARCHVGAPATSGSPAREVDHDMIAAGHPRLNFEFSAYQANMPHHWRDDIGPDSTADFPARAWAVGQIVSAQAALDLLRDRASRAVPDAKVSRASVWPELSEYDCFSCHHDLRDDPWRRDRSTRQTPLGRPRWGSWYFPLLDVVAGTRTGPMPDPSRQPFADLENTMRALRPDPALVALRAAAASQALATALHRLSTGKFDEGRVVELTTQLQTRTQKKQDHWDEAAQTYLALVPLSQAQRALAPEHPTPQRAADLERLREFLKYPEGFDGPRAIAPPLAPEVR
jgi:Cytochrome c554 and c-prime